MEIARGVGGARRSKLLVELARYAGAARDHARQDGVGTAVRAGFRLAHAHLLHPLTVSRRRDRRFEVAGNDIAYELTRYNNSWLNERTVEIALARHFLAGDPPGTVLEIGNVLRNYRLEPLAESSHVVVDKHEEVGDVVNDDARYYRSDRRFAAVVSISTLEHIGFDEKIKDADGPVKALETMRHHMADDGVLLVTVPLGYNPGLDTAIRDGRFSCPEQFCLRRISQDNTWVQDSVSVGLAHPYGSRYNNANAVYVGIDRGH